MKRFIVHKEVVAYHSGPLKAGINKQFLEGQTGEYIIDDVPKGAFQLMVQYMYREDFEVKMLQPGAAFSESAAWDQDCEDLVNLWM